MNTFPVFNTIKLVNPWFYFSRLKTIHTIKPEGYGSVLTFFLLSNIEKIVKRVQKRIRTEGRNVQTGIYNIKRSKH